MIETNQIELERSNYELFILALSTLSLLNILFILIAPAQETKSVIAIFDFFLSIFFIGDFIYRLFRTTSKSGYLFKDFGWLDFLGSLPINGLRIARLFRIARVARLLRKYGLKNMFRHFSQRRAGSALLSVLFFIILALEFGSAFILQIEAVSKNANILTPSDALWWTFVTITTVGYGDHFPVTTIGRLVGVLLMTSGIGLFSVFTGFLANAFLKPDQDTNPQITGDQPENLQMKLAELYHLLDEQNRTNTAIKNRIEEIEQLIED